jgi:hypothetical protein
MEEGRQQPEPPESAPPLVVEVELSQADFSRVWAALPQIRRQRAKFLVLVVVAAAVGVGSVAVRDGAPDNDAQWFAVILPMLFTGLLVGGLLWLMPRSWARRAVSDIGGGPMKFRFDDAGLEIESPLRRHQLAWAALPQHLETDDAFVIYTSSSSFVVVPKRAFVAGQLEATGALLRRRISTKPVKSGLPRAIAIWAALVIAFLSIWHFLRIDRAPTAEPDSLEAESP